MDLLHVGLSQTGLIACNFSESEQHWHFNSAYIEKSYLQLARHISFLLSKGGLVSSGKIPSVFTIWACPLAVVVRSVFVLANLGGCCCWLLAHDGLAFALANFGGVIVVMPGVPGGGDEWIRPLARLIFLLKQRHHGAAPY